MNEHDLRQFEQARPTLLRLACRILESRADAEDAVQDCFLRWTDTNRAAIATPAAWLSTVCTHRCLDLLRAGHRSRVDYVGPALPEQLEPVAPPDCASDLGGSPAMAFVVMLDRLTPKERAAYLLHDVFELPFAQIAALLQMKAGGCQKLVERARAHIGRGRVRHATPADTRDRLLRAFQSAIDIGDPAQLVALLARDIHATSRRDKATGAFRVLEGYGQSARAHTLDVQGDDNDRIADSSGADHRRCGQDRRASQRAA